MNGTIGLGKPAGFQIEDVGKVISSGISLALIIAGILAFVFLIWGGIEWLMSGGDKTNTQHAKDRISSALVGLAIVATSWAIMRLVSFFFGIDVFSGTINIPKPY